MPRRAMILIVGFWAFLTIITPTLILWSKSERDTLQHSSVEERVEIKARKMLHLTFAPPSLPIPPSELLSSEPSPSSPSQASSPSPSPASSPGPSSPPNDHVTWD